MISILLSFVIVLLVLKGLIGICLRKCKRRWRRLTKIVSFCNKKTLQRMLTQTEKINKENLVYVKKHFREC